MWNVSVVLAEVEVRLRLDAKLFPRIFEVSPPASHAIMAVVDRPAHPHRRMDLNVRIAEGEIGVYVARIERLCGAAGVLDVPSRHSLTSTVRSRPLAGQASQVRVSCSRR
jgi:hypothetical protein